MEYKTLFSALSVVIGLMAFVPYLRDVFSKSTKPHVFTWLIWAITQGVGVAGMWFDGGGKGAIGLTIAEVLTCGIFLLSLRGGLGDVTKSDKVALSVALGAIVVWVFLDNPLAAVMMVSVIDIIGGFPTFRKSYHHPWSETLSAWCGFVAADVFAILALENYSFLTLTYIVSITTVNVMMVVFLVVRRKIKRNVSF